LLIYPILHQFANPNSSHLPITLKRHIYKLFSVILEHNTEGAN